MSKRTALVLAACCLLCSCEFLLNTPFSHYLRDRPGPASGSPDLRLRQGLLDIPPGATLEVGSTVVGVPVEVSCSVVNLGEADLQLSGDPPVAIDGADAAAFAVSVQPATRIEGGASSLLTICFLPSATGAKTATASIESSDPDTGIYSVTLTGTGTSQVPTLPYQQISDPSNWACLQEYLNEQAALGVSGPPSVTLGSITVPSGGYKWVGGVLAPNGKIYCLPRGSSSVLIIDPATDTGDITTIAGLSGSDRWSAGVLAPNGKVYGIPFNSTSVLILDPVTNTADTTTITGIIGSDKWQGGILASNGRIYGIPRTSTRMLIIDPEANTASTKAIGVSGSDKWFGGVLAPNGKIYCVPFNAAGVLIIDPATDTADNSSITGLGGSSKWYGGVLAPNGKIYCIPYNATSVMIIDPQTNTVDTTTITGLAGAAKWQGGVLAPDGRIYGIPRNSTRVLIIDPVTNTADTSTITGLPASTGKWAGGILAPNGKIYAIPADMDCVLIIDPKCLGTLGDNVILSAYFNVL